MTQVWMCASCHSLNEAAAKHCYKCRTARATGEYVDQTGAAGAPGTRAIAPRDPSLLGGILFGLVRRPWRRSSGTGSTSISHSAISGCPGWSGSRSPPES